MGFRFRRSIKILPGIRLNFGKRGVSTSIGPFSFDYDGNGAIY